MNTFRKPDEFNDWLVNESLYKALSPGARPRYDTVFTVLRALGVTLHAESTARNA